MLTTNLLLTNMGKMRLCFLGKILKRVIHFVFVFFFPQEIGLFHNIPNYNQITFISEVIEKLLSL